MWYTTCETLIRNTQAKLPTPDDIRYEQGLIREGTWSLESSRIVDLYLPNHPAIFGMLKSDFMHGHLSFDAWGVAGRTKKVLQDLFHDKGSAGSRQDRLQEIHTRVLSLLAVVPPKGSCDAARVITEFEHGCMRLRQALNEYKISLDAAKAHAEG